MFNRPEKRNAMSPQLHREMFELLTEIRYDASTVAGRAWSSLSRRNSGRHQA
jgi:enoyl-CoA hydratase/carnithine racemase